MGEIDKGLTLKLWGDDYISAPWDDKPLQRRPRVIISSNDQDGNVYIIVYSKDPLNDDDKKTIWGDAHDQYGWEKEFCFDYITGEREHAEICNTWEAQWLR